MAALVNGAAILAARRGEEIVQTLDFKQSLNKMLISRLEMMHVKSAEETEQLAADNYRTVEAVD